MAKDKNQKKEITEALIDKIKRSKSIIFTTFQGLTVKESEEIRTELKDNKSEYFVVKKTLLNLALAKQNLKDVNVDKFYGQIAAVFGYNDEVAPAKIMAKYKKELKEKLEFLGGVLENSFIDANTVVELSSIPSREELYAKLVGSLNSPISGFINVLVGNQRKLIYALKAIQEKKN